MKYMPVRILSLAFTFYAGLPAHAASVKTPDMLSLDQSSPTAIAVVKTDWWQPAPSMQSAFKLTLSPYDPVEEKLGGGVLTAGVLLEAKKKYYVEGYLMMPIKPGRWIYLSYSQQDKWALCFNAASWQFDVKPGEVVYLGEFDALAHRRQLAEQAVRSGRTSVRNSDFADFFDLPEGPRFKPIDEAQLNAVRGMLARQAPRITAPVRAVAYSPAKFGTGSTLFAERRCGGYFATGAKGKAASPAP